MLETREDFEESETLQREALKLSEVVNGRLHIDTVNCMAYLAEVLHSMRRSEEASELATEAARIKIMMLGPEHRTVLTAKSDLAFYLGDAGRVEEAIGMYREVVTLKETVLGPDHPETLITAKKSCHSARRRGEAQGSTGCPWLHSERIPSQPESICATCDWDGAGSPGNEGEV